MNTPRSEGSVDPLATFNLVGTRNELARLTDRDVLVLAGPGSGKTHLLCAHAVWIASRHRGGVLLLTFTQRAAQEMETRVRQALGDDDRARSVTASTMHSWCLATLRVHGRFLGLKPTIVVLDQRDIEDLASEVALRRSIPADAAAGYARWLEAFRRERENWPRHALFETLREEVDDLMKVRGAVDPGALIRWTVDLLRTHEVVRESIRHHRPFVLVDEAQDCDAMQLELLGQLVGVDRKSHLFLVMDPDQSLYGWRGASARAVYKWSKSFEPREEMLTENYRCATRIQALAAMVLGRATSLRPPLEGHVSLVAHADMEAEAKWVAAYVSAQVTKDPTRAFAVLGRADWRVQEVRSAVTRAGVATRRSLRVERSTDEEIAIEAIRAVAAWRQQGDVDLVRTFVIQRLRVSLGEAILGDDAGLLGDAVDDSRWIEMRQATSRRPSPAQLLNSVIKILGLAIPSTSDLLTIAQSSRSVRSLLAAVRDGVPRAPEAASSGVLIGTFHGAKGLEFDGVIVLGCEDGVVPGYRSFNDPQQLLEERRALFVAVTRAAQSVIVTYVQKNSGYAKQPSRFLPVSSDAIWGGASNPNGCAP